MRKVAIIQARMGSTRLPGKVLMDLAGEPMLARVVERARRARHLDEVVVATTDRSADDVIEALCSERGWKYFRGSETDVLDRYCRAAQAYGAGLIVRITSDCPLTDPLLVDDTIECLVRSEAEYSSNVFPRTYPRGLDVEAFAAPALERAWREARAPYQREHVTAYIYEHPELFRMASISGNRDYSSHRWTVDTPEDLEFARLVFQHFKHDRFSWEAVLPVLEQHPDWVEINRHVMQKTV